MSVEALLPRSGRSVEEAINGLLASLMENGVVDAVLVPMELPSGQNVTQALIRDRSKLQSAVPVSPVMPVNSATVVSNLTVDQGKGKARGGAPLLRGTRSGGAGQAEAGEP